MLCLAGMLLALAGCGESGGPSGPPGAHPMMGPPGAPRPGVGPMASGGSSGIGPNASASPGLAPPGLNPPHVASTPNKDKTGFGVEGDKKDDNPLASVIKIEEAGNLVNLASEIIAAGVNPFFSRLPRPLQPDPTIAEAGTVPTTDGQTLPAPPADPLDGINLLGIVYNPKSPIALISVPNAKYASQVVRTGDLLTLDQGQAIVGKITQQSIDIQMLGKQTDKKGKRTILIPDIIGYASAQGSTDSGGGSSSSGGGPASGDSGSALGSAPSTPKPASRPSVQSGGGPGGLGHGGAIPAGGMAGSPMGTGSTGLSNLKRLASGVTGSSAASPGANVVLKEP